MKAYKLSDKFIVIFLSAFCIGIYVLAALFFPLNPDAGMYLSYTERIYRGAILYKDLSLYYTPLVFYIMLLPKLIFGGAMNYEIYLSFLFFFQFLNAFLIYKIGEFIIKNRLFAFYAAVFYLLVSYWNEGIYFVLEPVPLLFGLLALWIYLSRIQQVKPATLFLIGVLCSLSFLSKQYAVGFVPLILVLIAFDTSAFKSKITKGLIVLAGFVIPVAIASFIFNTLLKGDFWNQIAGTGYGHKSVYLLLDGVKSTLMLLPVLVVIPFYLFKMPKADFKYILMLVLGCVGFAFQFYFQTFSHYLLFIFPFASILMFYMLQQIKTWKWIYLIFFSVTILITLNGAIRNRVFKIKSYALQKQSQFDIASAVKNNIKEGKTLYIADIGLASQYYLTGCLPPNLTSIAYDFGSTKTHEKEVTQIDAADYVIIYKKKYDEIMNSKPNNLQEAISKKTNKINLTQKGNQYDVYLLSAN